MRRCFKIIAFSILVNPATILAQSTEHEDVEIIKPSSTQPRTIGKATTSEVAKIIVKRTSSFRVMQKLDPVVRDSELEKAARYFAGYMAEKDKYGHTADGNRPAQRAKKFGYEYCIVSENIAYQYHSNDFATKNLGEKFFEGWKNSPGHRKNMLDPDVTETGVAVVQSKESGYYYSVQMFGRSKSAMIEFSLRNKSGIDVHYKIGEQQFTLPPRYTRTHTRCRPSELIYSSDANETSKFNQKIEPADGSEYAIETFGNSELRIRKK